MENVTEQQTEKTAEHRAAAGRNAVQALIFTMLAALVGAVWTAGTVFSGSWPQGADIWGHLFKVKFLYDQIKSGCFFPQSTQYWYNGTGLFRYWPPLSYYIAAGVMFVTGLGVRAASAVYSGLCVFIAVCGFTAFGSYTGQRAKGFMCGVMFAFLPYCTEVMLFEGNLPRMLTDALLPWVYYYAYRIIRDRKTSSYAGFCTVFVMIMWTHLMMAAMTAIVLTVWAFFWGISHRSFRSFAGIFITEIVSFLPSIWILVPGLTGGMVSQKSQSAIDTLKQWSQNGLLSLNPAAHYINSDAFYFGTAFFVICIFGLLLARKDTFPGFIIVPLVFIGTTLSFVPIAEHLPLSQAMWMRRFVPMAYAAGVTSVLLWKRLKKSYFAVFFAAVLAVDCSSVLAYAAPYGGSSTYDAQKAKSEKYLLEEASDQTVSRLAFLDLSKTDSFPSFRIYEKGVKYMYGWAYQGAGDMKQVMEANESAEFGFWRKAFLQTVNAGCDTVLVYLPAFSDGGSKEAEEAAAAYGYSITDRNSLSVIYRLTDVKSEFGTVTEYPYLAIGTSSYYISYMYPAFDEGRSEYLDDYTAAELGKYSKIYLSGFKVRDKAAAEKIVSEAAAAGTHFYIDAGSFEKDRTTGQADFLGVSAQTVEFNNNFPVITGPDGLRFGLDFSVTGYPVWRTVYLVGCNKVSGSSDFEDRHLAYAGTGRSDNITFLGFNLVYYETVNPSDELKKLVGSIFGCSETEVPEVRTVPFTSEWKNNVLTLNITEDGTYTGIPESAAQIGTGEKGIYTEAGIICADKGTYVLKMGLSSMPAWYALSGIGAILCAVYCAAAGKRRKRYETEQ